jgi:hypothetical protein
LAVRFAAHSACRLVAAGAARRKSVFASLPFRCHGE